STSRGESGAASLTAAATRPSWPAGAATTTGPRLPCSASWRTSGSVTLPARARSPCRPSRARRLARGTRYSGRSPGKAAAATMCSRRSSGQIRAGRIVGLFSAHPPGRPSENLRLAAAPSIGRASGLDAGLQATREQRDLAAHLLLRLVESLGETVERDLAAGPRLPDLPRGLGARARAQEAAAQAGHRIREARLRPGDVSGHRPLDSREPH